MQQLNEFLRHANYQPAFNAAIAAVSLAICFVVVVLLLHTLYLLGQKTPLYQRKKPPVGWSKRIYMAGVIIVAFCVVLIWLLGVWRRGVG